MWWMWTPALAQEPSLTDAVEAAVASTGPELRACLDGAPGADGAEILVTLLHGDLFVTVFPAETAVVALDCVRGPLIAAVDVRGVPGPASAVVAPRGEAWSVRAGATPQAPERPGYVARVVRRHERDLDRCGRDYAARGGEGRRAEVTVWVSPEGDVTDAGVTRSELDPEADACVVGVFRGLRFHPPDGGPPTVVTWPIDLGG